MVLENAMTVHTLYCIQNVVHFHEIFISVQTNKYLVSSLNSSENEKCQIIYFLATEINITSFSDKFH